MEKLQKVLEVHRRLLQSKTPDPKLGKLFEGTISVSDAEETMVGCVEDVLIAIIQDLQEEAKKFSKYDSYTKPYALKYAKRLEQARKELLNL